MNFSPHLRIALPKLFLWRVSRNSSFHVFAASRAATRAAPTIELEGFSQSLWREAGRIQEYHQTLARAQKGRVKVL